MPSKISGACMIKGGRGGERTKTGLEFENRARLQFVFEKIPGYAVDDHEVFYRNKKVAELYSKNRLYSDLLDDRGIAWKDLISKKLLPDSALFVPEKSVLFIIELKFQQVAGSVDEKLQTCGFKIRQYKRLMGPLGIKVEYVYVLNDWFKHPSYQDTLDYVHEEGCHYFFEEIPLDFLALPIPSVQDSE
jgi:hypothetical protein